MVCFYNHRLGARYSKASLEDQLEAKSDVFRALIGRTHHLKKSSSNNTSHPLCGALTSLQERADNRWPRPLFWLGLYDFLRQYE